MTNYFGRDSLIHCASGYLTEVRVSPLSRMFVLPSCPVHAVDRLMLLLLLSNAMTVSPAAEPTPHCLPRAQIWQCYDDFLNLVDCDTACYGSSCQNTDCSQSILIPSS